ncbi:MAG: hypothetical protein PHP50_13900 [Lachnospiraceae bacterium]|nr:hypothetical protein [Lachnospiraceae bacterium]
MKRKPDNEIQIVNSWTGLSAYIVYENTVIKLQPAVEETDGLRTPKTYEFLKERDHHKTRHTGLLAMLGLIALMSTVMIAYASLWYSNVQRVKKISALEAEYHALRLTNDETYTKLLSEVDLEEIERKAIYEYGMQRPSQTQIVHFEKKDSDYVRQLKKIEPMQ